MSSRVEKGPRTRLQAGCGQGSPCRSERGTAIGALKERTAPVLAGRYCGAGPWPDLFVRCDAVRLIASIDSDDWGLSVTAEVAEAPWSAAEWAVALRFENPRATVIVLFLG